MHEGLWLCGKKIVPAVNIYIYICIIRVYIGIIIHEYYLRIYIYNIKILYYRVAENVENKM